MRNRLFLLVLVAVILLLQAVLRSAAVATPFSSSEMAGGIPFWELRGALPLGVCCAGILLVSTAALLLCAQAALQIGAHRSFLQNNAGQLASACLWCGAPLLAMCLNALPYIFPWLKAYDPTSWQTSQHLDWILNGSIIVLVLCRTVSLLNRPGVSYSILPLSLFCLLALGQMCFAQPLILLPGAAMTAAGLLMLLGRGRRWAAIPLLTGIIMEAALFMLTAAPEATTPAAVTTYTAVLALISTPFYLKLASLRAQG